MKTCKNCLYYRKGRNKENICLYAEPRVVSGKGCGLWLGFAVYREKKGFVEKAQDCVEE